ncbi:hypothetical protein EJ05DRAFT_56264 [Pseudovirgaria hyperparasitica]|uniref:Cyclic-AMP phosphodiesterase n=1 Tax=Pseudovirgaria hyperparasitica TaxID=470096 RepID=A0A6A6W2P7_9PEZI|nr:uncharacterized protein EJ05DRAFT_56264 [Pseudovirgaria hyperparasitica]KAF2757122.1 hypothetical protein EJ05DRAFT_56264 [Pseudovirgaria hyperparasitica]
MKDGDVASGKSRRPSHTDAPAIQVICLGSGGGPNENNVTGFLVRSIASNWAKGSVLAVDAGSHLAAITHILENHFPLVADANPAPSTPHEDDIDPSADAPVDDDGNESATPEPRKNLVTTLESGPFAGLPFPHASARANASYLVREHVSTYLITHPHLDHVSGFVINTAAFHNTSRPKRLAALPFTVNAIKTHLFNDIIWPNLTDEDGGVGFVTFQRLAEGGNIALGEGPSRGFIEVCDGLGAKGFKVSHGHCMRGTSHVHRGSITNLQETSTQHQHTHPQGTSRTGTSLSSAESAYKEGRSMSFSVASQPGTPQYAAEPSVCVVDSTAYFIRAEATPATPAREVLIFGDVEPDSISLSPRTANVWAEAAPKIAQGMLTGIFIECSYTDSQADQMLFGHIAPRHLIAELKSLAAMVCEAQHELSRERDEARKGRKRKRQSAGFLSIDHAGDDGDASKSRRESRTTQSSTNSDVDNHMYDVTSPRSLVQKTVRKDNPSLEPQVPTIADRNLTELPLKGVKVVIIHVKDTLDDGPVVGDIILQQLHEHEENLREHGHALGCEFVVSASGEGYYF